MVWRNFSPLHWLFNVGLFCLACGMWLGQLACLNFWYRVQMSVTCGTLKSRWYLVIERWRVWWVLLCLGRGSVNTRRFLFPSNSATPWFYYSKKVWAMRNCIQHFQFLKDYMAIQTGNFVYVFSPISSAEDLTGVMTSGELRAWFVPVSCDRLGNYSAFNFSCNQLTWELLIWPLYAIFQASMFFSLILSNIASPFLF